MLIIKTIQVKSNRNLTNLCARHLKNIQCITVKKGTLSVVYVEDKKGPSQFKQTTF